MAIQGLRNTGITGGTGTDNSFVLDQRPLDWRSGILLLYPNGKAPLIALTSQMKKRVTTDPEFNWWDKQLKTQRYALTTTITGAVTTLSFAGGGAFEMRVGHVIQSEETGEILRVTAVTSDILISVERGAAGTTGTAITVGGAGVNPNFLVIGSAFEEGSAKPTGLGYDPTKQVNYTQIFRWNIGMTRTAAKTRLRTGDAVREAKREALEMHSIEMERALWLGSKFEELSGSNPRRYTGGFVDFVDPVRDWTGLGGAGQVRVRDFGDTGTPGITVAGEVDMQVFEEWLKEAFEFGSSEKVAFCGNRALLAINQIVRKNSSYQIFMGEKEYGMRVMRVVCPFGEIVLKTHPLWNMNPSGSTGGTAWFSMDTWVAIVDMANLTYRPLTDSDTKYVTGQESPGDDGVESGYITEMGMEFAHPVTHALARGFNKGVVDA